VGGTPPTSNGGSYTENLTVGTVSTGDVLTIDISFTVTGNLTVNSGGSNPTITIPAGVTVIIVGNFTDANNNVNFIVNGTLIITGTLQAKNNAVLGGTGTVSGGVLNLSGNGGSAPSCSSGGCPVISFNDCTTNTNAAFCSANNTNTGGSDYVWNGSSSSDWQTAANWTPTRTSPNSNDMLTFSGSGSNKSITNVPTQTVGNILVTGSSVYSFTPSSSGNTLVLSKTTGYAAQIDNGSTLTLGPGANVLNATVSTGGTAQIGGQVNLNNSIFTASSTTLILHTNSSPLAVANGSKINTDGNTILNFGMTGLTSGTITLPNSIFNGPPTISSIVMNTASATLGNQPITVSSATFTTGILYTNSPGSLNFSSSATNPTESSTSYISGYATMNSRAVGTGALNFLGFSMAAGSNVGNMTIVRRTGSAGINTFPPTSKSIASSWDITSSVVPVAAQSFSFLWQSAFDNTNVSTNKFQTYINTGSGFVTLGASQVLSAQGPPRQSATVSTTSLSATFTLADQNNALPITLISFIAKAEQKSIDLKWSTASELNFDYFNLEKSSDGKDFNSIAKIKGHGTTNNRHDYSFEDNLPLIGKNYYRLTSVDFDNYQETFYVIVQDYSGEKEFEISPNPSNGRTIDLHFNFDTKDGQVVIYDNIGSVVESFYNAESGELTFASALKNGIYFAKYSAPSFTKAIRFLVSQ
jgi:hypothetical protein